MKEIGIAVRLLASFIYNVGGYSRIEDMSYTPHIMLPDLRYRVRVMVKLEGLSSRRMVHYMLVSECCVPSCPSLIDLLLEGIPVDHNEWAKRFYTMDADFRMKMLKEGHDYES